MKKVFLSAIIAIATMWANVAHAQGGLSPQQVQQKAIETTRVAGMETQSSMTIYSPSGGAPTSEDHSIPILSLTSMNGNQFVPIEGWKRNSFGLPSLLM